MFGEQRRKRTTWWEDGWRFRRCFSVLVSSPVLGMNNSIWQLLYGLARRLIASASAQHFHGLAPAGPGSYGWHQPKEDLTNANCALLHTHLGAAAMHLL